jgi:hypothetical protein
VGLDEITGKDSASTDTTVVRTLGTWETVLGPTEDLSIGVKESVFLLETEPWLVLFCCVHGLLASSSVVGLVGCAVVVVTFTQDKDVGTASEGVFEDGDGALESVRVLRQACCHTTSEEKAMPRDTSNTHQEDIRVVTRGLVGR